MPAKKELAGIAFVRSKATRGLDRWRNALQEDVQLDARQATTIIQRQFPEVSLSTVTYLGEGCDSTAFEVNQQWVFRFPKRGDVDQQLALESRILPVMIVHSPLPLPSFCFHGQPSEDFPYHFVGYRKLPGVPAIQFDPRTMPLTRCALALGQFLTWLHQFSVTDAEALGVPRQDVTELMEEVRTDALDDFELLSTVTEMAPLQEWRAFFTAGCPRWTLTSSTPVLVHRDLASEHVLCDPETLEVTGIIDWSEIAISDRSVDLAGSFHWGGQQFIAAVLSCYEGPIDEGMLARARFLAACRGVGDVAFGLKTGRPEYVDAGTRALMLCIDGSRHRDGV
jgi:aminoglycoside phosphotransferase (APT) family kinase protein